MTEQASSPARSPKIRIRGLYKSFGSKHVLNGVDLDVEEGTSFVIIGGSGTGKSVLLRCILGLITPDAGTIEIDGRNVLSVPQREREAMIGEIGMLFQNGALFDSLTVWENVSFALLAPELRRHSETHPRLTRAQAKIRAGEILNQVGLDASVGDLSPSELSGGMQKRVGLARAIADRPKILFFDEPTTGLDPIMGAVIDGLIVDCVKQMGSTAIAITHDMASAQRIGDEAAMLYKGRLVWQGPASSLMNSGNPLVDQFTHGRREGPITMELRR
ncbi:ABC transporter ATP-binding protein [Acetobacter oeni]|uniref:ABC transporter ATP-binding protein n=1 Tax=Acetobacter oeni TaxID=304077 RepID=A0A511XJG8_9PROT|nr:ATP-binding cassette domain-containing protein [Acetobacter oeni]MBB3883297.1 phospholipid/cholesterol/gamma-HCH transport system ATP-binding protein [Acetobacter oeni]NHO19534.1 ATP-binding cassette domain-containing protein [Acetobacter oeni]GBR00916.1 ABC transporter ATP-binding protein [Acetobacter oeni LMG 21952]GEN63078.1 ABC transporter ATP-binding protein [Acetobacter oeni]